MTRRSSTKTVPELVNQVIDSLYLPLTEFISDIAKYFGSDKGVSHIKARQIYLGLDPIQPCQIWLEPI